MNHQQLRLLLDSLRTLPNETEWVEFKHNNANPKEIGEYLSALSNSAILHDQSSAWLVWGIEDKTHNVIGTSFRPRDAKKGNQELEGWLLAKCHPRLEFRIHEFDYDSELPVVMFEITPCWHTPVRFEDLEFIRVGSTKRRLKDFPEKERLLWERLNRTPFEKNISIENVSSDQVLDLLDYPKLFELLEQPLPDGHAAILEKLVQERFVTEAGEHNFHITNLGAILFAKRIEDFESISRKAIRVIEYKGNNRIESIREKMGSKGYANGFEGLLAYINDRLPSNEELGQALRKEVHMYPEIAIRELVANALIHQDFSVTGDGPKVEIFEDRVEITNPGRPLIKPLRFVDEPPQSRNEILASLMRRMNICEERGSGIDKTLYSLEHNQLPAPEIRETERHTIIVLFAATQLDRMEKSDRIRACYFHACLKRVSNEMMTNESLRNRLNIPDKEYPKASRIIRESIEVGLIKPFDPESNSRKHAKYLPFWA